MKNVIRLLGIAPLAVVAFATTSPRVDRSKQFYEAIRNDQLVTVGKLATEGSVNCQDADGNTPLIYAAVDGSVKSVQLLLKLGANPNLANSHGTTPLLICAGDAAKVKLLLNKGAKVNQASKLGRTPLELAASYDNGDASVRLLIAHGAKVNSLDSGNVSPLEQAASANNLAAAKVLIEHGAHTNNVDKGGFTPLLAASGNGYENSDIVRFLLAHGAKPNVKSGPDGGQVLNGPIQLGAITPIQVAAPSTYAATKALLDAGANVNATDIRNSNSLVFAVATDHPDPKTVSLLLAHGAKPEKAIAWAKRYNNPAVLAVFGLKPTPTDAVDSKADDNSEIPPEVVRAAMSKALGVCQAAGAKFRKAGGCVSCHAQLYTGLAVQFAKPYDVKANYALEAQQTSASVKVGATLAPGFLELQDPGGAFNAAEHLLLHMSASGPNHSFATDSIIHYLCATQRKEGDWPVAGGRPPSEEGRFTFTAYAVRLLKAHRIPALGPEIDHRIALATAFLKKESPTTFEDRSMQILGLAWSTKDVPQPLVKDLIDRQRPNGGWGQTDNLPADAYATGKALMALREAGTKATDPAYAAGVRFLLRTQQANGAWHVVTRSFAFQPYFQGGFPYDHDQWISHEGTALATIALGPASAR